MKIARRFSKSILRLRLRIVRFKEILKIIATKEAVTHASINNIPISTRQNVESYNLLSF